MQYHHILHWLCKYARKGDVGGPALFLGGLCIVLELVCTDAGLLTFIKPVATLSLDVAAHDKQNCNNEGFVQLPAF